MGERKRRAQDRDATRRRRRLNAIVGAVVVVLLVLGSVLATRLSSSSAAADSDSTVRPCPTASASPLPQTDLPDQSLECLGSGPALNFASLAGKPTIINVWASWCPPCVAELPWIAAFDDRAKGAVQVIGVDVSDDRISALSMLRSAGVHYPSVFDPQAATRGTLQWSGTPITLFIDANGTVVHREEGRMPDATSVELLARQYLGVTLPAN